MGTSPAGIREQGKTSATHRSERSKDNKRGVKAWRGPEGPCAPRWCRLSLDVDMAMMRKSFQHAATIAGLMLVHSLVLVAATIFAFMCSFDAPQGGDAYTREQSAKKESAAPFLRAGTSVSEAIITILKFPSARLSEPLPVFRFNWWLNSFIWACGILVAWKTAKLCTKRKSLTLMPTAPSGHG